MSKGLRIHLVVTPGTVAARAIRFAKIGGTLPVFDALDQALRVA